MALRADIAAALRLINTPTVGPKKFYRLVEEQESVDGALALLERESKYKPWSVERALQEIDKAEALEIQILLYTDEAYPKMLLDNTNMPPVLYAKGCIDILQAEKSLAIVGSRAASINGRKTAAHIAKDLTESGVMIVSGMARGIDAAAHKGALYAQGETGATIAVLGTGLDVIYPPENTDLYHQIEQQGCLLSEVPLGTQANALQFPRRNRIVAALSEGVLVVEAGLKSGSLITAQLALDMKKTLFAVPGTPGESRAQGSNHLIKKGAVLVENADDILPFLKGNAVPPVQQKAFPKQKILVFENKDVKLSNQQKATGTLADFLTVDGIEVDELIRLTGKDAATISLEILDLEMSGLVERRAGNKIALIEQD